MLTRPMRRWQFVAGKVMAGIGLLAGGLALVLGGLTLLLHVLSGIGLGADDVARITLVWGVAVPYTACFFLVSFILSLHMKQRSHAMLVAFAIWLTLVLIAPQIGDTLDPGQSGSRRRVQAIEHRQTRSDRNHESFTTFETVRDGIEQASVTKHFERFTFAVLGIKATYAGMPLGPDPDRDAEQSFWIFLTALGLGALALALPLNPERLAKPEFKGTKP